MKCDYASASDEGCIHLVVLLDTLVSVIGVDEEKVDRSRTECIDELFVCGREVGVGLDEDEFLVGSRE